MMWYNILYNDTLWFKKLKFEKDTKLINLYILRKNIKDLLKIINIYILY